MLLRPSLIRLLFATSLVGAPCAAQAVSYLRPTVDTIAVTVESRGQVISFATAIHSIANVSHAGRMALELTYRWFGKDGSRTADTLWIDAKTLAPLENHRHNGMQDAVTTFKGSNVRTQFTLTGKAAQTVDTTVTGALHASGELEELIRSSPLALGFSAAYTLYYGPPGRLVRPATFKVVASEVARDRSGKPIDCWVVDAPLSEGLNTFFVSKTDRRVVRLVNHEDPNAAFVFTK